MAGAVGTRALAMRREGLQATQSPLRAVSLLGAAAAVRGRRRRDGRRAEAGRRREWRRVPGGGCRSRARRRMAERRPAAIQGEGGGGGERTGGGRGAAVAGRGGPGLKGGVWTKTCCRYVTPPCTPLYSSALCRAHRRRVDQHEQTSALAPIPLCPSAPSTPLPLQLYS